MFPNVTSLIHLHLLLGMVLTLAMDLGTLLFKIHFADTTPNNKCKWTINDEEKCDR